MSAYDPFEPLYFWQFFYIIFYLTMKVYPIGTKKMDSYMEIIELALKQLLEIDMNNEMIHNNSKYYYSKSKQFFSMINFFVVILIIRVIVI